MKRSLKAALVLSATIISSVPAVAAQADDLIEPGSSYSAARILLVPRGYALTQLPKQRCIEGMSSRTAICEAYPETAFCPGTGLTNCQFAFREPKGDWLLVQTEAEKRPTVGRKPVGFIFSSQDVRDATTPGRSVRLGEKISRQALTKLFTGYDVRYAKGEDCLTCATISGGNGQFELSFAKDGRTIIDIKSHDERSRDAQGNAVGASLLEAVGSTSAQCDAGMDTTCASPSLKGLWYIVAEDDRCPITVKEKRPTDIPACARIAGFQILAINFGR